MPVSATDLAAQRLAAIVECSDDAIISMDLNGLLTSWNRAAERIFGYTAAEAVGRSLRLIIPRERWGEDIEALRRIRNGETVDHFETVRRHKNGTLLHVSVTMSPIRDTDGNIVGVSKISRDISDRRRAEKVLEEVQTHLVALVEASGSLLQSPKVDAVLSATISIAREQLTADGYAFWRVEGEGRWRIVQSFGVSEEFAARTVSGTDLGGLSAAVPFADPLVVEDVFHLPMVAAHEEAYRAEGIHSMLVFPLVIGGSRSATLALYYRHPRQFTEVELQTGRALGNLAATAITVAELYERQESYRLSAEQERQRAAFLAEAGTTLSASLDYEKTLRAVAALAVPHIADWCGVDVLDEQGRLQRLAIAHVDPRKVDLARMLRERYPEERTARGGVNEVLRTGRPVMMSEIPESLLDQVARDEEHRRLLRELALASYMCVPLTVRNRTFGVITFVMAESGRRYVEADLAFAEAVASRAALAVENARAYQRVNEASRIKDEFLATLSHELRTPLNAILGYARMLRRGMSAAEQDRAFEVIERNAVSLNQIIEDVLDVSRIVSGKLRLDVQPVRLPDVLEHAVASALPAASGKSIRIETIVDPLAGAVSGDPDRLQQIVWNLLSNAVKFTPKGGRVQVRLERVNSHVEIIVADTGQGIDPQFLPHVFERFRQADSSFSRGHGGLGLGLAIVREIVEMHGGSVQAESDGPGTGATFRVRLPVMIVHTDRHPEGARVHPTSAAFAALPPGDRRLEGVRILAVDDEQDSLGLLRTIFEGAGATVRTASSAALALMELDREVPDVFVCDLGMPEMDGLALIRRIRQSVDAATRSIPALALTAYARSEDRVAALAHGFQMHVAKPADPAELVVAVASLARRADTRASGQG